MKKSFIISTDLNIDIDVKIYIEQLIKAKKTLVGYYELNVVEYDYLCSECFRLNLNIIKIDGLPMNYIIITGLI